MTTRTRRPASEPPAGSMSLAACVSAALAAAAPAYAATTPASDLDEIVVTATRRDQAVTDIPYNISAIGEADLKSSGATTLQDLARLIPGLVAPDLGSRGSGLNDNLTIRGLNASSANYIYQAIAAPLVSTYVDETPLFVNLKLTDIARVEVLRGPQGTLYGSGSVGGTIRMIHNEPDTTATEVQVTATASSTSHAGNPSGAFDGVLNLPISDNMAFRGSAGYEKLAGFTDALSVVALTAQSQPVLANPSDPLNSPPVFIAKKGIDASSTWYARGAVLWKVSDGAKITLSYQHQTDKSDGFSQQRPGYDLSQTLYVDQPGTFDTDLVALDVSVGLGFATLSSASSYTSQTARDTFDATALIESLAQFYGNYPRISSPIFNTSHDKSFTEELRLVSKSPGPWDWVLGGYYSHRDQDLTQIETNPGFGAWSEIPGSGVPAGCTVFDATTCPYPTFGDFIQFYNGGIRPSLSPYPDLNYSVYRTATFKDLAAFGEASYHFTDKWQVTGGARIFWQNYAQNLSQTLPDCGPFCSASGTDPTGLTAAQNEKSFRNQIFKLNTSYAIAPHMLVYATWSEGFRRGGVNTVPTGPCYYCEPASLLTYEPDTARNSELGIKGSLGRHASYTLTVYNIDWSNPQIEATTAIGGFPFVSNGVKARSRGVEGELSIPLGEHFRTQLGYTYTDAKLTESFVRGYNDLTGVAGDPLPGVSKTQATAALEYSTPLAPGRELHARLDGSYRSSFWSNLPHSPHAQELPGFGLLNGRLGMQFNSAWRLDAFVNNITNKIAGTAVALDLGIAHEQALIVNRPRTAGLQLNYVFSGK